jgi:hypothetical protein
MAQVTTRTDPVLHSAQKPVSQYHTKSAVHLKRLTLPRSSAVASRCPELDRAAALMSLPSMPAAQMPCTGQPAVTRWCDEQ